MISIPWIPIIALFSQYSKKSSEKIWHALLWHPQSKILRLLNEKKLVDVNSWLTTYCLYKLPSKSC